MTDTMTSTPASPTSHLLSAQTPKTPNPITTITSSSTPHTASQDVNPSLQSSFQTGPGTVAAGSTNGLQQIPFPPAAAFTFLPDLYNLISRLNLLEGTPQYKSSTLAGADAGTGSRAHTASPLLHRSEATSANIDTANIGKSTPIHDPTSSARKVKEEDGGAATSNRAGETDSHGASSATASKDTSDVKGQLGAGTVDGTVPAATTRAQEGGSLDIKDLPSHVYEIRQRIQAAREIVSGLPDIQRATVEQETEIATLNARIGGLRKRLGELGQLAATATATAEGSGGTGHLQQDIQIQIGSKEDPHDVVMKGVEGED